MELVNKISITKLGKYLTKQKKKSLEIACVSSKVLFTLGLSCVRIWLAHVSVSYRDLWEVPLHVVTINGQDFFVQIEERYVTPFNKLSSSFFHLILSFGWSARLMSRAPTRNIKMILFIYLFISSGERS